MIRFLIISQITRVNRKVLGNKNTSLRKNKTKLKCDRRKKKYQIDLAYDYKSTTCFGKKKKKIKTIKLREELSLKENLRKYLKKKMLVLENAAES